MRFLLFGKSGQVGRALAPLLAPLGQVITSGREEADLADPKSVERLIESVRPDMVINAAAYTAVDTAETDRDLAWTINGVAPAVMARAAVRLSIPLIHYSTDYVFDGEKKSPYLEEDPTSPISWYGQSKLAGEEGVIATGGSYLIFRLSWVYDGKGRNFLTTMQRLKEERQELRVVDDQIGAPTSSGAIARATVAIVGGLMQEGRIETKDFPTGLYHMSCGGRVSWYGFAQKIFELTGYGHLQKVEPIGTADYPTEAARPKNSVMDNQKLNHRFGVALPSWEEGLAEVIKGQ